MTQPVLEVADLKVHFGGVKAVDGVSLRLEPGKLYGLVGPNGSGKTTLLNALSRMTPITGGSVSFEGSDVTSARPDEVARAGISRTFQGIRLVPTLTVRENVQLGVDNFRSGAAAERRRWSRRVATVADEAIDRLGLGPLASRYPDSLSYGTQRRVEIARAVARSPRVLLLDEPVAGMNRQEREDVGEIIRSLRQEGLTQLLVEHDLRMVLGLSDHLFVLNFGQLAAEGPPAETAALPVVQKAYLGRAHVDA